MENTSNHYVMWEIHYMTVCYLLLTHSVMDYSAAIHIIDCFLIDGSKVAKQHT